MDSKQCKPSNSGANLGGFCLGPTGDDPFESFLVVFDSVEGKENLHFCPCAMSKWLKRDMNMLCCEDLNEKTGEGGGG
ncbi:hypothetical protein glysoja_015607 [Glycine soja]|nr:hypothetical protein JHK87_015125 [Glycine soja]KHN23305.1 hypothetical protein glysoja_015607 [Glycine soja]